MIVCAKHAKPRRHEHWQVGSSRAEQPQFVYQNLTWCGDTNPRSAVWWPVLFHEFVSDMWS